MGIPHLATHLQPYGVETSLSGLELVIDGPALAYHIYHLCCSNMTGSHSLNPSHRLLGETALSWLESILENGVHIAAIYFDGFLPLAKRPVRLDRLLKTSAKLQQLETTHPHTLPGRHTTELNSLPTLDGPGASGQGQREPPHTPPFLVPAILESLRQSARLQALVHLVPGEADAYCAWHVLETGGTVITSDSDLLVHDLGRGSVIFFRDIVPAQASISATSRKGQASEQSLSGIKYEPRNIAERLRLPGGQSGQDVQGRMVEEERQQPGGMLRFAFELLSNTHASTAQLLDACRASLTGRTETAFAEFCRPYGNLDQQAFYRSRVFSQGYAGRLDPRISELLLQSPSYRSRLGVHLEGEGFEPLIFLPLLLDRPSRASAWDSTTPIRRLAYSLFALAFPLSRWSSVREYRRIQSAANKGRKVDILPDKGGISAWAASLVSDFRRLAEAFDKSDERLLVLGLMQDVTSSNEAGREAYGISVLRSFSSSYSSLRSLSRAAASRRDNNRDADPPSGPRPDCRTPWSTIHFNASVQATYYSLRLLSQVIHVALSDATSAEHVCGAEIRELVRHINDTLPPLARFPGVDSVTTTLRRLHDNGRMGSVASLLDVDENVLIPTREEKGNRVKVAKQERKRGGNRIPRKKRKDGPVELRGPGTKTRKETASFNPFDVLGDQ